MKHTATLSDAQSDTECAQLLVFDSMKCPGAGAQSDPVGAHNSEQQVCEKHTKVVRKSSFLSSIMEVADKHTLSRPMSAPSRSVSTTLPSGEKSLLKQESNKKLKRKINIEEGARAALQYSAKHQNVHVKAMSLPRDHKPASLSHEKRSNGLSSATPSPKHQLNAVDSSVVEASIAAGKESFTLQNGEQLDRKGEMTNGVHASGKLELTDKGDGNTVEEKDIFVSFQAPQSPSMLASVDESKPPNDAKARFVSSYTVSEETARLRAASFSNKRKSSLSINNGLAVNISSCRD